MRTEPIPRCNRVRCWEFMAWASSLGRAPTNTEIMGFLDISRYSARDWRTAWFRFKTQQLAGGKQPDQHHHQHRTKS